MAQFNFTFEPGITFGQILGFEIAGRIFSRYIKDDITINLHVAFTDALPDGVIGGAVPVNVITDVSTVQAALAQDSTSTDDVLAVENLTVSIGENGELQYTGQYAEGTFSGDRITLTSANAQALGITTENQSPLDGYILLNNLENMSYHWNTDYGRTADPSENSLDLLSVILHELGHGLGFFSSIDSSDDAIEGNRGPLSLLDLYRYSAESLAQNAQELTRGDAAYFSIDGGETAIAPFASGIIQVLGGIEGYQASHWANNALDPNKNKIDATKTIESTTDFLTTLFDQSIPATPEDTVPELFDLLVDPTLGTSIFEGLSTNITIDKVQGRSLGIMDPALASGERSELSALDLQAFDVLGYDISAELGPIDYEAILEESISALISTFKLGIEDLIHAGIISVQHLTDLGIIDLQDLNGLIPVRDLVPFRIVNPQQAALENIEIADLIQANIVQVDDVATVQELIDGGVVTTETLNQSLISVEHLLNSNIVTIPDLVALSSIKTSIWERDRWHEVLDAIAENAELYERRRPNRKKFNSSFFQENDLDSKKVNILSDGAGETTHLFVDGAHGLITTVQANAPEVPLILRTTNLEGTDANDLIIPAHDVSQVIDAGDGNNVVQLGNKGGQVIAGDGHDTILSLDNDVLVKAGAGDNVVILVGKPGSEAIHQVLTDSGDDYIVSTGAEFVALNTGAGHDMVNIDNLQSSASSGNTNTPTSSVYLGNGNDIAKIQTSDDIEVSAGNGNDQLQIVSSGVATVTTGDGVDRIILGDRTGPFYADTANFITITDFSPHDRLQLYGTPQDYTIVGNELFYQGTRLARFTSGIHFTLTSPQLSFVDDSIPAFLDYSVVIPSVEETLATVESNYTRGSDPTYSIIGGNDANLFTIDSITGDLQFASRPSTSGAYEVIVQAEANGQTDAQTLTVNVDLDAPIDNGNGTINAANANVTANVTVQPLTNIGAVVFRDILESGKNHLN